jgi:hypothetical protein
MWVEVGARSEEVATTGMDEPIITAGVVLKRKRIGANITYALVAGPQSVLGNVQPRSTYAS